MPEARIKGRVDMDGGAVGRELSKASGHASAFAAKMKGIGRGLAGAFTIGAGIALGKKIIGETDRIADLAANVGLTTDELQAFEAVANVSGASTEKLATAMEKLAVVQGNIASGDGDKVLESLNALGVSAEEANAPIGQLFQSIAAGFAKTKDFGALDELFGRGASQLVGTLNAIGGAPDLAALIEEQRGRGLIIPAGEVGKAAGLEDWLSEKGSQILKYTTSALTAGANDTGAIAQQKEFIAAAQRNREQIAARTRAEEVATQQAALEKIIAGGRDSSGLGSSLVRIGARGGIAGGDTPAVKVAKETLATMKKVEANTAPIKDIETGNLVPP